MAGKAKHAQRSHYSSHNYIPFHGFYRHAVAKAEQKHTRSVAETIKQMVDKIRSK